MSDEREPWDDARLDAAFARYATGDQATPDLTRATVARLRSVPVRGSWRSGRSSLVALGGLAAAAVLVIALAAWPRPTPAPAGQPTSLAELPVIGVPELIERMADPRPEEVIVHGWFAVAPVEADCEVVEDPHPLIPDCEEWYRFLAAEPDDLHWPRGGTIQPTGPYVVPMLRIDSHIEIASESGEPVEVRAVGHMADHRSGTCTAAEQPECVRRFVIDRLLPADGEIVDVPDPWLASAPPTSAAEDAVRALASVVDPMSVVSIGTIAASDLATIEPIAAGDEPVDDRTLWVVRAFVGDQPVARTFTLVDGALGTSPVSEITARAVTDVSAAMPSDDPAEPPTTVLGLPVIDVATAIEHRDAGDDSTELAVRGWVSPDRPHAPCPADEASFFLEPVCTDSPWDTLTAMPTPAGADPATSSLEIAMRGQGRFWAPPLPAVGPADKSIELVVVGHFDDERSAYCPADLEQACRDRFVVDRVAMADGVDLGRSDPPAVDARSEVDEVLAAVRAALGDRLVLSLTYVPGEDLRELEPALFDFGPNANPLIQLYEAYWIVRVLEGDRAVRYLLVDGFDAVSRIDAAGSTYIAGQRPPPPHEVPPSSQPAVFPVEVAGLPVIDIDAARQVRVRPDDARELAIAGWYEHPPTMDCLPVEDPTLLSHGCPGDVDDPHLLDADGDPGVHLIVATPIERPTPGGDPVPVVVVGHFDDRRAEACPVERRTECQNAFVVDAIWMDGRLGAGAWELATDRAVPAPATTRDWVNRAVRKVGPGPGAQLLSVGLVRGPDLTRIEPGGTAAVLANETWVWHATVLFGDEIWTFLLPDDDLAAFAETGSVHGYQIFDAGLQEFWSVDGPPGVSPAPSS